MDGRIHYAKFTTNAGGVARNMCEALSRLGSRPTFLSAVGNDSHGRFLCSHLPYECRSSILILPEHDTAQCTVVLDAKGDSRFLIGDMSIHNRITPEVVSIMCYIRNRIKTSHKKFSISILFMCSFFTRWKKFLDD